MPRVFLIKKKRDAVACMTSSTDTESPARGDDESRDNTEKDTDDDSSSETARQPMFENNAETDTREGGPSPVQHELTEDKRSVDQSKPEIPREELMPSCCVLTTCPQVQPAAINMTGRICESPSQTKGVDAVTLTSTRQTPSPQLQSSSFSPQRSPAGLHDSPRVSSPTAEADGSRVTAPVPCKRHSDFSAEFLLSRDAGRRALLSTVSPVTSTRQPSELSLSKASLLVDKVCEDDQRFKAHAQLPRIPSPAKCAPPCLFVSSWLESSLPLPTPYPDAGSSPSPNKRSKSRDGLSSSPEADRLDRTCAHLAGLNRFQDHGVHEGFSAFRRTTKEEAGVCRRSFAPFASKPVDKRSSEATIHRRDSRISQLGTRATSPPLLAREKFPTTASHGRRLLLASSSSSSSASCLLPPTTLSLGSLLEQRRGSSTSPAHSERTSSGSESPPSIFDGSPTQQHPPPPHFADELPWSHIPAAVAPSADPFVQSALGAVSPHHLLSMGLPYLHLPGLARSLSDLSPSHSCNKSAADSLASAFKSTRHPFLHPVLAAAAYYSNLRRSLPFPFSYPAAGGGAEVAGKPLGEKVQTPLLEHLDVLRGRHRLHLDPMAGFPPSKPQSPTSAGTKGRPAPATPPSRDGSQVGGRKKEPADHSSSSSFGALSAGVPGVGMPAERVLARGKEHDTVRYQCEACSKSYSTFSGLSKHKQFHCAAQVKKEFSCKYCDKTYVSLGALKMHIRTHTLPCKCGVCGKAFSRPWLLQGHVRTHTGEKPFTCPHCARAFADRSNLRAHLQTHSDVKKYSCRACSKTFSRMSLLTKHRESSCVVFQR